MAEFTKISLTEINHCMYRGTQRTDLGCLHCPHSMKLGMVWTCWYSGQPKEVRNG